MAPVVDLELAPCSATGSAHEPKSVSSSGTGLAIRDNALGQEPIIMDMPYEYTITYSWETFVEGVLYVRGPLFVRIGGFFWWCRSVCEPVIGRLGG